MRYLVLRGSFLAGAYRYRGDIVELDESLVKEGQKNLKPLSETDLTDSLDRVEMSALGPTGPNPTSPQQVPPDARQTIGGYQVPGAELVGEVTRPKEERIDASGLSADDQTGTQEQVVKTLRATDGNAANNLLDDTADADDDGLEARSMTKDRLMQLASDNNVQVETDANKAALVAALRKAGISAPKETADA